MSNDLTRALEFFDAYWQSHNDVWWIIGEHVNALRQAITDLQRNEAADQLRRECDKLRQDEARNRNAIGIAQDTIAAAQDTIAALQAYKTALESLVILGYVTQERVDHALRVSQVAADPQFKVGVYGSGQYGI